MRNFHLWPLRLTRCCFVIALGLALAGALSPARAQTSGSDDNAKAVDTTVDIIVTVGGLAGLPLTAQEGSVVKAVAKCAMGNGGDCIKNIIIQTVLDQIKITDPTAKAIVNTASSCLVNGGAPQSCLTEVAVSQLPAEARPFASCALSGNNIKDCTEKAILAQVMPQVKGLLPEDAKATVDCVIAGKNLASCAKDLLTKEVTASVNLAGVPSDVAATVNTMVKCVSDGGDPGKCAADAAKDAVLQKLPPDVRDITNCLSKSGGDAQKGQSCVANFAASKVPDPTAAAVVACMGKPGDQAQKCITDLGQKALGSAAQQAQQQAIQQAMQTIDKLKVTSQIADLSIQPPPPAVLQNIVKISQGIRDKDWSLILEGGGTQFLSIAGKIILSIFLSPPVADLLGPAWDAMLQNDVNALREGFKKIKGGDPVGLAQVVFQWYETTFIQAPCALLNFDAMNTACGEMAKAIKTVAQTGGDIAKGVLGVGKDVLQWLGLWNTVDDLATDVWQKVTSVVDDIGHFLGLGGKDEPKVDPACAALPKPSDYLNSQMSACFGMATASAISNSKANTSGVVAACQSTYGKCAKDQAAVQSNCQKIGDAIATAANNAKGTITGATARFATYGSGAFVANLYAEQQKPDNFNGTDFCSASFWSSQQSAFIDYCAQEMTKSNVFPASFSTRDNACPIPAGSAIRQACAAAAPTSGGNVLAGNATSIYCKKQKVDLANWEEQTGCKVGTKTLDFGGKTQTINEPQCPPTGSGALGRRLPFPIAEIPGLKFPTYDGTRIKLPPPGVIGAASGLRIGVRDDRIGIFLRNDLRDRLDLGTLPFSVITAHTNDRFLPWTGDPRLLLPPRQIGPRNGNVVLMPPLANDPRGVVSGRNSGRRILANPTVTPPAGPGSGGAYYVNGASGNAPTNGNSAMDRLGNMNAGAGLGGVAGNSGGAAIMRQPLQPAPVAMNPPKPPPASGGSGGAYMVNGASGNSPTKGGSGGAYMVNGASGNSPTKGGGGSGGAYMVNGASGNSPTTRPSTTTSTRPPPNRPAPSSPAKGDDLIMYGGCSSCNKPPPPPLVVR